MEEGSRVGEEIAAGVAFAVSSALPLSKTVTLSVGWAWLRETFSRMREICEWTAWRDWWSLRAISEGRWLSIKYWQMVACFSVRSMAGWVNAARAISSSLPYLLRR